MVCPPFLNEDSLLRCRGDSEGRLSPAAGCRDESEPKVTESYEYDLIGVTVHTGTADGGHYYSFIRDIVNPHAYRNNKW